MTLMNRTLLLLLLTLPLQAVELTFPKLEDAKRIHGELVSADFVHRGGQFRTERGELMDFTMPPYAIMRVRGAESDLSDVPLGTKMDFMMLPDGKLFTTDDHQLSDPEQQKKFRDFTEKTGEPANFTLIQKHALKRLGKDTQFTNLSLGQRYRFHCYQDAKCQFTCVTFISDEFSHLTSSPSTTRITSVHDKDHHIEWLLPLVKDYNRDMQHPEPFDQSIVRIRDTTKVWIGDLALKLTDLKTGDEISRNLVAEMSGKPSQSTEIWTVESPAKP